MTDILKIRNLFVLLFVLLPMLVVGKGSSLKMMSEFSLQQNFIRYNKIFTAVVVKTYPTGYRKKEMSFDVAALKVDHYYKAEKKLISSANKKEFVIYLDEAVKLEVGKKYLFFVTIKGFVGVGDPPLLIKRGKVKSLYLAFAISKLDLIFKAIKKMTPVKLRKKFNKEYLQKRAIDRKRVDYFKQAVQAKLMQEQIKGVTDSSKKIAMALQLGDRLKQLAQYDKAAKFYNMALQQKGIKAKDKFRAKHELALLFYHKGSPKSAISALLKVVKDFQFTPIALATLYLDLGSLSEKQGAIKKSIVYYKKTAMFAVESPRQASYACYYLGKISNRQKDFTNEKLFYKKSIYIYDKLLRKAANEKIPSYYSYMKDRLKVQ